MGAWGQQTPPSPFQPGGLRHGGGMKKNGGGVCKGDAVGGCSARDALQRCWGGWGGERMAAVRSWGSCARTRARCAGFVPPHASWGGGNTQDGARTRRDHRHPLSLAHVHRHPHHHAHPLQQPQPPGKVPAPGFQPPPKPSPPSFTPLSSQPSSCCSFQLPFTFPQPTLGEERRQRPPWGTPQYLARVSGTCSALSCSASLTSGGCGAARGSGQRPQAVPMALGHAQPGGEAPQRCQPRGAK